MERQAVSAAPAITKPQSPWHLPRLPAHRPLESPPEGRADSDRQRPCSRPRIPKRPPVILARTRGSGRQCPSGL